MTIEINLTPFESAILRATEFGENVTQLTIWALTAEKLNSIENPDSPEGMAQRFAIENLFSAMSQVPGCVSAEA
jgi:hypothetical protein